MIIEVVLRNVPFSEELAHYVRLCCSAAVEDGHPKVWVVVDGKRADPDAPVSVWVEQIGPRTRQIVSETGDDPFATVQAAIGKLAAGRASAA